MKRYSRAAEPTCPVCRRGFEPTERIHLSKASMRRGFEPFHERCLQDYQRLSLSLSSTTGCCSRCRRPFTAGGRYQRSYCSAACCYAADLDRHRDKRPLPMDRECVRCGESFTPARSDARYCSGRCRVAAHRASTPG